MLLGVIGLVADYYLGRVGSTPAPHATTAAPAGSTRPLASSLDALMGLKPISSKVAPGFTLTDQHGASWTLRGARGHAVVLTFYNSTCTDICPVVGEEIRRAESLLGPRAHGVDFVVVNTDPRDLKVSADPPALSRTGLDRLGDVYFLTGSLSQIDPVWSNYGVTITVGRRSTQMAHNEVMYFIGQHGGLADLATPFANESRSGTYTLGATQVARWAEGIAQTAGSLVP